MTGLWYLLGAYLLSLALLWGYAASLWMTRKRLQTNADSAAQRRA